MIIIKYKNINEEEFEQIINIFKDKEIEISEFNIGNKIQKEEKKNKLLKLLEVNERVECNKNVCFYLGVHTRTLSRYIRELTKEKKIKSYLSKFKDGGRGYTIESVISKEKRK